MQAASLSCSSNPTHTAVGVQALNKPWATAEQGLSMAAR